MDRFFSPDSKFYATLDLATDLVILNVLYLATSLPVFTLGASTRALLAVTAELSQDRGVRLGRDFLRNFRAEFGRSTLAMLPVVFLLLLAAYEFVVIGRAGLSPIAEVLCSAAVLSGVFVVGALALWYFLLLSLGAASLATAAVAAIRSLPLTLVAVLVLLAPALLWLFIPAQWGAILAFQVIIGCAFQAYLCWLLLFSTTSALLPGQPG